MHRLFSGPVLDTAIILSTSAVSVIANKILAMALSASRRAIASPLSWPQKQRIMIPEFDENGNLPPGVYFCQWEEFKDRFGTNLTRARIIDGLELAISQLKAAGCRTVYINGSFVTDEPLPGDFDACYDLENVDLDFLRANAPKLLNCFDRNAQKAKYKGEIFPSNQPVGNYGNNSFDFFQKDRKGNKKGIIAIDLMTWND